MNATLEDSNAALRDAVKMRLDNTPKDDPKMVGYSHFPTDAEFAETMQQLSDSIPRPPRVSVSFISLLEEIKSLHSSKSADYGSEVDPLANIRNGADFVNISPWKAALVRIADKVQRLRTYCRTGRLVHEGVRDTLLDLASYSLLAIILHDEEQAQG